MKTSIFNICLIVIICILTLKTSTINGYVVRSYSVDDSDQSPREATLLTKVASHPVVPVIKEATLLTKVASHPVVPVIKEATLLTKVASHLVA
ncbi:17516_t:CDS:2 [Cetraspora pellucida]|uniref:17516_t:CDS:1 n=1 Tax=Cetraspora pellucida TaxID=1433469 RepID=A0A9N9DIN3_9GLOM|nr:17516_t:CDS:2 [Cetraspora pellucida]